MSLAVYHPWYNMPMIFPAVFVAGALAATIVAIAADLPRRQRLALVLLAVAWSVIAWMLR